jgi:hypothetical protein
MLAHFVVAMIAIFILACACGYGREQQSKLH